jgi:hypothetical protein
MKASNETLETYSFKTKYLCVNVGCTKEWQQSNVVTEKKKSKTLDFKNMEEEHSQSCVIK